MRRAKAGGAEIVKEITEEKDKFGYVRYAVVRTVRLLLLTIFC